MPAESLPRGWLQVPSHSLCQVALLTIGGYGDLSYAFISLFLSGMAHVNDSSTTPDTFPPAPGVPSGSLAPCGFCWLLLPVRSLRDLTTSLGRGSRTVLMNMQTGG